jgi:hypothetical protein
VKARAPKAIAAANLAVAVVATAAAMAVDIALAANAATPRQVIRLHVDHVLHKVAAATVAAVTVAEMAVVTAVDLVAATVAMAAITSLHAQARASRIPCAPAWT